MNRNGKNKRRNKRDETEVYLPELLPCEIMIFECMRSLLSLLLKSFPA